MRDSKRKGVDKLKKDILGKPKEKIKKDERKNRINKDRLKLPTQIVPKPTEIVPIPDLKSLFPIGRCRVTVYDYINQIDRVYKGLGIPVLYGTLSILANKSVFFIGGRGTGKTRTIKLVPTIEGTNVSPWSTFTYQELSDYCQRIMNPFTRSVRDRHLVFKIEEFATFQKYHKELFLTVGSRISSDGSFVHVTRHSPFLNIQNCRLTMLVAIQPILYNKLCTGYDEWEALSSDRFTKFIIINPLRNKTLDAKLIPTLPRKINQQVTINQDKVNLNNLISMFKGHVSEGRATSYARDYAVAMTKFMGAKTVEQKHIDLFHKLFHPYLNSFAVLQRAKDLDSPVMVATGSMRLLGEIGKYMDYVTKAKLAKDLHVSERSIERPAKELLAAGLIEKPSEHAAKYRLSKPLREYFQRYNEKSQ